jgi:hypothetical protein
MPHVVHMGFAIAAIVIFLVLMVGMTLSEFDSNPVSTHFLAQANPATELAAVFCKAVMIIAVLVIEDAPKFRSLALLAATAVLCSLFLTRVSSAPRTFSKSSLWGCAAAQQPVFSAWELTRVMSGVAAGTALPCVGKPCQKRVVCQPCVDEPAAYHHELHQDVPARRSSPCALRHDHASRPGAQHAVGRALLVRAPAYVHARGPEGLQVIRKFRVKSGFVAGVHRASGLS